MPVGPGSSNLAKEDPSSDGLQPKSCLKSSWFLLIASIVSAESTVALYLLGHMIVMRLNVLKPHGRRNKFWFQVPRTCRCKLMQAPWLSNMNCKACYGASMHIHPACFSFHLIIVAAWMTSIEVVISYETT